MRSVWITRPLVLICLAAPAALADPPVHGLWVWKSAALLAAPSGVRVLLDFCKSATVSEIYVSLPPHGDRDDERRFATLIATMHGAGIRVEALLSSIDADLPGAPRAKLLERTRSVLSFNARHTSERFDGIHLDIEPQQRTENKGPGNLGFLQGLADAYRDVGSLTARSGLTLNADVQIKLLKGDAQQRRALLTAIPRLTLMLYELSSPDDGTSAADKERKLEDRERSILDSTYQGLGNDGLAKLAVGLRTPDYGPLLPRMLALLDQINLANPHYLGWARHSYNDTAAASATLK